MFLAEADEIVFIEGDEVLPFLEEFGLGRGDMRCFQRVDVRYRRGCIAYALDGLIDGQNKLKGRCENKSLTLRYNMQVSTT